MPKYYAWSPITVSDVTNSTGRGFTIVPEGAEVTKTQVGEDWSNLLASGVIRTQAYPKNVRTGESPKNAMLRRLNEAVKRATAPFMEHDNPDLSELEEEDEGVVLFSQEK